MLLLTLFAKNNYISKRILPIYRVNIKHKSSITSNKSICPNHLTTYLGKNNNVTLNNYKRFSTSKIDITSEIIDVKPKGKYLQVFLF
jgi:hypothetical protein